MVDYDKYFTGFNTIVAEQLEAKVKLYYPELIEDCPNCYLEQFGGVMKSISTYKTNGPIPFDTGMPCPYCNGAGHKATEQYDTLTARIYPAHTKFFTGSPVKIENGSITAIFLSSYYPQVKRAKYMVVQHSKETLAHERYELAGEPEFSFGMNPVKYITTLWHKIK